MANEEEYESHRNQFPTQESHTELRKFTTSSRGEVDECEDENDGGVDEDEYTVEKFMKDGKHFSHGHPLSLTISSEEEEEEEEDDDFCKICRLPILSSPSYTCTKSNNACKFFLHQQCALKLPPKIFHRTHEALRFSDEHNLHIELPPLSSTSPATYKCEVCDFKIHPLVVVSGIEIKIKHRSHPSHEMVAVCKVISCECDACGKIQQGFFFSCQDCNFWIHQDCTILPNIITLEAHPLPFILSYSLPSLLFDGVSCLLCRKLQVGRHNGFYFCPQSSSLAHVACAMEKFASKRSRLELMQLPEDEWDAFPSSVIRRYAARKPLDPDAYFFGDGESDDDDDDDEEEEEEELTIEKYHNHDHQLILTQVSSTKACVNLACDLCTRPITIPIEIMSSSSDPDPDPELLFYTCTCVNLDCHFVAHKICADILRILKFFIPLPGLKLRLARHVRDVSSHMFNSIFYCLFCHRPCNGLCYSFGFSANNTPIYIDLECMAAPTTVKHASHAQHILFRTHSLSFSGSPTPLTCCHTHYSFLYDVYRCIMCDYFIHINCAMLPKRITFLEYHHHPLHLLFTTTSSSTSTGTTSTPHDHDHDDDDGCFCEVCEKHIDLKYWSYRCFECDQYFHINCIPSVGYLSKVKFGGTVSLPNCHSHPLALTRMLTVPTQRCAHCKQIIQGLVDEIAFFCSRCHFWLHFSCAARQTSNQLKLYSDFVGS